MSISSLPLSYCTNVHLGLTLDAVRLGLREYTARIRERLATPLAAGLWLAHPVIEELDRSREGLMALQSDLQELGLSCHTLNAFPYGNFHNERVKEQVYLPDWTTAERLDYTVRCAQLLSQIMPLGVEGSISTVPLGFKALSQRPNFIDECLTQLLSLARSLDELHDDTGRIVRLAIEPEPLCVLETTRETVEFFIRLRTRAAEQGLLDVVRRHIGVCYDVCHQAVEFEDVAESIRELQAADIRINKVHITCAIELPNPADAHARGTLAKYVEPRYLHQTFARLQDDRIVQIEDLNTAHCEHPPQEFAEAQAWRVHFHVPVNAEQIDGLRTTRDELRQALQAVAALDYAPHLEVETYTWGVLPSGEKPDLVSGITQELAATRELLNSVALKHEPTA